MSSELSRMSLALLFAMFVSFALFSLMQNMISEDKKAQRSFTEYHSVDFVRLPGKEEETETVKRVKPIKPQMDDMPDSVVQEAESFDVSEISFGAFESNLPAIETPLRLEGSALARGAAITKGSTRWQPGAKTSDITGSKPFSGKRLMANSEVIPLVRIQPRYPPQAARRNLSGYVIVEFTIKPDGTVNKAKVVDSKPKRVFDAAALQAIKRWKFKPKLIDGKAVVQYASQKFNFQPTNR